MTLFLVVGLFGIMFLVASLALGDLDLSVDADAGGLGLRSVSLAALAAALAAFGLGGSAVLGSTSAGAITATAAGAALALAVGAAAVWVTRVVIGSDHEPTRSEQLLGVFGTVITRIPADGLGEVAIQHAGTRVKLSARSSRPVPAGATIHVVEIASPTCLVVEPLGL